MLIMGIDPGLAIVGYGIVEKKRDRFEAVAYNCIRTKAVDDLCKRLSETYAQTLAVILRYKPEVVAVEDLYFNTNAKSAFMVGQARGVILLAASHARIPVVSYTPLQVKQAIAGYGRAEKEQVQYMVKTILNLQEKPRPDDVADALALAICHGGFVHYNLLTERK